jgi:hypothetical protein
MPPHKELHYFGTASWHPLALLALSPKPQNRHWRLLLDERLRALWKGEAPQYLNWYFRYIFFPRSDAWYSSLFRPADGQLSGEISPEYARLPEQTVRRIHAMLPELKIIYLLRDPIERAWSQAAKYFSARGSGGLDEAPREEVQRFLARPGTLRHSSYASNLEVWERYFPRHQIFVGFYDQLVEDPGSLLVDIYRFLGLEDSEELIPEAVRARHNARSYTAVNPEFSRTLAPRLKAEIERIHERFGNRYTEAWRERAHRALAS